MPWSGPVADSRGWVGGTHYVPKTGLGGFDLGDTRGYGSKPWEPHPGIALSA